MRATVDWWAHRLGLRDGWIGKGRLALRPTNGHRLQRQQQCEARVKASKPRRRETEKKNRRAKEGTTRNSHWQFACQREDRGQDRERPEQDQEIRIEAGSLCVCAFAVGAKLAGRLSGWLLGCLNGFPSTSTDFNL